MLIFRYLAKDILINTFAVGFILLSISLTTRFVKFLAQASAGVLEPDVLFAIMGYRLPGFLELILPLAFFIALLLSFGRLYIENEITVMFAAGVAPIRLVGYTLAVGLAVAVFVGWLSLVASPSGLMKSHQMLQAQKQRTEIEKLLPRNFMIIDDGAGVVYAENVTDQGILQDVFLVESSQGKGANVESVIVLAKTGHQVRAASDDPGHLVLQQGTRIQGQAGSADYQQTEFAEFGQRLFAPKSSKGLESDDLPTKVLRNSKDLEHIATYQWRLSIPLLVLVVSLLAIPLSKANPRQGRYVSMLPAILIYMIYLVSLNAARDAIGNGSLPPSVGLWLVHGIFIVLAVVLLSKRRFV